MQRIKCNGLILGHPVDRNLFCSFKDEQICC